MRRIVVFGSKGFVGKALVSVLKRIAVKVIEYDLPEVDISQYNTMKDIFLLHDDVVVNLAAAQYGSERKDFVATNVTGVSNIIHLMNTCGCKRLIHFSSNMAINPVGPYGRSKAISDGACQFYMKDGLNITILRPRLIIGPGRAGVLSKLFWLVKHNLPVPMIGDGSKPYHMVSVYDCVSAVMCAIDKGCPKGVYDLQSDDFTPVRELLQNFIRDAGSRSVLIPTSERAVKATLNLLGKARLSPLHKEQYEMVNNQPPFDIRKTKKELGWEPRFSDRDMLLAAYMEWRKK